jgi:hypothetical protein
MCHTTSHKHQLLAKCVPLLISQTPVPCQMCAIPPTQTPITCPMCAIPPLSYTNYLRNVCPTSSHKLELLAKYVPYLLSQTQITCQGLCYTSSHKHQFLAKCVPYLLSQTPIAQCVPYLISQTQITCPICAITHLTNTNYFPNVCHTSS